jgi:hypothetical protein
MNKRSRFVVLPELFVEKVSYSFHLCEHYITKPNNTITIGSHKRKPLNRIHNPKQKVVHLHFTGGVRGSHQNKSVYESDHISQFTLSKTLVEERENVQIALVRLRYGQGGIPVGRISYEIFLFLVWFHCCRFGEVHLSTA